MALSALVERVEGGVSLRKGAVVPLPLPDSPGERFMAVQTPVRIHTSVPELMTLRAIPHAFEMGMGIRQLPWREELARNASGNQGPEEEADKDDPEAPRTPRHIRRGRLQPRAHRGSEA